MCFFEDINVWLPFFRLYHFSAGCLFLFFVMVKFPALQTKQKLSAYKNRTQYMLSFGCDRLIHKRTTTSSQRSNEEEITMKPSWYQGASQSQVQFLGINPLKLPRRRLRVAVELVVGYLQTENWIFYWQLLYGSRIPTTIGKNLVAIQMGATNNSVEWRWC